MKKIIKIETMEPKNRLRIEYMAGNYCNFKCSYCGPHANGGDVRWPKDFDMLFIGDGCNLHYEKHKLIPNKNIYQKCLYPTSWGGDGASRCADSYIISKKCANKLCEYIKKCNKINLPIDWWLNVAARDNDFKIYWAEPTIVTQGSQNGLFRQSH